VINPASEKPKYGRGTQIGELKLIWDIRNNVDKWLSPYLYGTEHGLLGIAYIKG